MPALFREPNMARTPCCFNCKFHIYATTVGACCPRPLRHFTIAVLLTVVPFSIGLYLVVFHHSHHESATRSIDVNVWVEIRNFKKCLIMTFDKQDKDVVFLETVMGLAKQWRHCVVDCIPLRLELAKEAPLYFNKAIQEAEDEWSLHNNKKLIDTSKKGLRSSVPEGFPYFHLSLG